MKKNTIEKTIRFYDYQFLSVDNPAHKKQYFDITITIQDKHFKYDIRQIYVDLHTKYSKTVC